ncbi:uncharacterized protein BDZ83DRAFT_303313 [Colletotrichum acutatum]|uniref:Uncharacterized protein n=1 Tax=Glomerella acutata TaxID=27357 RepID=A0AAD8ULE2_GLOAC|nr:uncharacterized protein BDZ83DRAFT_303313 [Colletotrichum acutatum]KAK1725478.1 hypothetical protein BDZ83DRAFT_303313 [Colletotrichum acutatum]
MPISVSPPVHNFVTLLLPAVASLPRRLSWGPQPQPPNVAKVATPGEWISALGVSLLLLVSVSLRMNRPCQITPMLPCLYQSALQTVVEPKPMHSTP